MNKLDINKFCYYLDDLPENINELWRSINSNTKHDILTVVHDFIPPTKYKKRLDNLLKIYRLYDMDIYKQHKILYDENNKMLYKKLANMFSVKLYSDTNVITQEFYDILNIMKQYINTYSIDELKRLMNTTSHITLHTTLHNNLILKMDSPFIRLISASVADIRKLPELYGYCKQNNLMRWMNNFMIINRINMNINIFKGQPRYDIVYNIFK